MMFDDLSAQFHHQLWSAMKGFEQCRTGEIAGQSRHLRAAVEAATVLYHFNEHLPGSARSRADVALACPDFDFVGDIANVTKHNVLNRRATPLVRAASDIQERTVFVQFEDDDGTYVDCETVVVAKCTDGIERSVFPALVNVFNYWGGELERQGVLKGFKPWEQPAPPGKQFVLRSKARGPGLSMTRGVGWNQNFQLLKWAPDLGEACPVNLSGGRVQMRIYKPSYTMELVTAHPNSGEPLAVSIVLTDEEAVAYHAVREDGVRAGELMTELAKAHEGEISSQLVQLITVPGDPGPNGAPLGKPA